MGETLDSIITAVIQAANSELITKKPLHQSFWKFCPIKSKCQVFLLCEFFGLCDIYNDSALFLSCDMACNNIFFSISIDGAISKW